MHTTVWRTTGDDDPDDGRWGGVRVYMTYNGDHTGDVRVSVDDGGRPPHPEFPFPPAGVVLPIAALRMLVAEGVRGRLITEIEQASPEELLGIGGDT